ncbi:MAG: hypothetical protein PHH14_01440 [Candidatus Margulisbacteria bacterium]|nr:hypothetical protein [Candidatus Margulisiibacteriota bacterium]
MDIVKAFTDAWNIYIKNFFTIFLATLVVIILGALTLGLLFIPLMIGLQMLFVKAKRGEAIALNDIFAPVNRFFALFFGNIWIVILVAVGLLLLIVPGLCWASWWMYSLLFIFDKKLGIGAGMRASKEVVRKNNLWMHLLFLILASVVAHLGSYIFWVGIFLTFPLGWGAVACAYADESK